MLNNHALKEQKSNIFVAVLAKIQEIKSTRLTVETITEDMVYNWLQSMTSLQLFNKFSMSQEVRFFTEFELNEVYGTITQDLVIQLDKDYNQPDHEYSVTLKDYLIDSLMDDFSGCAYLKDAYLDSVGV